MTDEGEPIDTDFGSVLDDIVREGTEKARNALVDCPCPQHQREYDWWLAFGRPRDQDDGESLPPQLPPSSEGPPTTGGPGLDLNDDPPPDIDSGGLADWYNKGL